SYSCLLTGAELAPFMPLIAADAPLASDNERPAAPSASTTLLRRFRGVTRFIGGMTLPSIRQRLTAVRWCSLRSLSANVKKDRKVPPTSRFLHRCFGTNFPTF